MGGENDEEYIEHLRVLFGKRDLAARQIWTSAQNLDQRLIDDGMAANEQLRKELIELVRSRQDGRGDDLISATWRDADRALGAGWDENDVLGIAVMIWDAAHWTTIFSTANGLYLLLTHPSAREQAVRDPARIANLVEESLRLYGPSVTNRTRIARRDFEFGGVQIRAGDLLRPVNITAGRDPRHYSRPNEVDVERDLPRDHFSLGAGGRHTCAGQAIARAELAESIAVLLERLPDVELDSDAEPPHFGHGIMMRMWKPLHVRFQPRPRKET
jgi:cytochrome P450